MRTVLKYNELTYFVSLRKVNVPKCLIYIIYIMVIKITTISTYLLPRILIKICVIINLACYIFNTKGLY